VLHNDFLNKNPLSQKDEYESRLQKNYQTRSKNSSGHLDELVAKGVTGAESDLRNIVDPNLVLLQEVALEDGVLSDEQ